LTGGALGRCGHGQTSPQPFTGGYDARSRLTYSNRERCYVSGGSDRSIPAYARLALEPLGRQRGLSIAGGSVEDDRLSAAFVKEPGQARPPNVMTKERRRRSVRRFQGGCGPRGVFTLPRASKRRHCPLRQAPFHSEPALGGSCPTFASRPGSPARSHARRRPSDEDPRPSSHGRPTVSAVGARPATSLAGRRHVP
jgi:hypothetical protein